MEDRKDEGYEIEFKEIEFAEGGIERRFVKVPEGATHAIVTLRARQSDPRWPPRFWTLHSLQITIH